MEKHQGADIYECVEFNAAHLNLKGMLLSAILVVTGKVWRL